MKLYIEDYTPEININEVLLHEYVNADYDYDLTYLFLEILSKDVPIKLDSEYINDANDFDDATEDNIRKYAKDPTFKELKNDMHDFAKDICDELEDLPYVDYTKITSSDSVGMSTYITVKFKEPTKNDGMVRLGMKKDPQFLGHYLSGFGDGEGYGGEYKLKFRLSNHDVKGATDAGVEIDILGKVYDKFKSEVLNKCERHNKKLEKYLQNFLDTMKIPEAQKRRNKERREREAKYNGKIHELLHIMRKTHIIKESYSTEALMGRLDYDVQSLIRRYYINTEDIIDAIQVYFRELPIVFADLVDIAASCINSNIHNYILDTGNFDLQAFLNDMETIIITEYPEYFI